MISALLSIFSTEGFMPHGHCYLWTPSLVWTMVSTDVIIGLAYVSISISLYALVRKIQIPFHAVFLAFGLFIFACGATHFMEVYTLWTPNYWLSALVKVITAVASMATAIALYPLKTRILAFAEAAKLSKQRGVELEQAYENLEARVKERTADLQAVNEELKQKNAELKQWEHVFQNASWGMSLATPDHQIISVNKAFAEMHGTTRDYWSGRSLTEMFDEESRAKLPMYAEQVHASGHLIYESTHVRADGSTFPVLAEVTAFKDEAGNVVFRAANFQDITARKRYEEALKESENQFKSFANTMPQLAWQSAVDGAVTWFNDRWYEYTGASPEEMLGGGWRSVLEPSQVNDLIERWEKAIQKGEAMESQILLRGADGGYRWFLSRVTPIRNSQGQISKWFGTATNIDVQRRLQTDLESAVRSRDEFLSIASHELKTPITSLKLQLELTQRTVKPDENKMPAPQKLANVLGMATRQIVRLEGLVEDLLDVAKIRTGTLVLTPEEVQLGQLLREVVERFEAQLKESKTAIEMKVDESIVGYWDRGRIEQVIANLISNAIKYAPGKPVRIGAARESEDVLIHVEDQGAGIPKEKQAIVFERFERATDSRNISGLGLGLFIVRQIIESHQGKIHLMSEPGHGAHFVIRMPLRPDLKNIRIAGSPEAHVVDLSK